MKDLKGLENAKPEHDLEWKHASMPLYMWVEFSSGERIKSDLEGNLSSCFLWKKSQIKGARDPVSLGEIFTITSHQLHRCIFWLCVTAPVSRI